ncbi:hypothetical protein HPNQ4099_1418 [Helicobacter pylori NQ4099]|uniref:Uncharacterized protein n=2 Tax=Helicobacter pylori TaxID=210 RepID=I9Q4L1_HELPX|nr:hypothetical protein HPNQ4099_1418 [Helicobacter pylori NQ4099]EJB33170.1 hypothetical protein HPNQ4076_1167 [Helicobacter pylori NQ4076]
MLKANLFFKNFLISNNLIKIYYFKRDFKLVCIKINSCLYF